jgi:hypothetical protein
VVEARSKRPDCKAAFFPKKTASRIKKTFVSGLNISHVIRLFRVAMMMLTT